MAQSRAKPFLCRVTLRTVPTVPASHRNVHNWTRSPHPGCRSRQAAPQFAGQGPLREISLEVSALLVPFTAMKFQGANRAESAGDGNITNHINEAEPPSSDLEDY